MEVEPVFSNPKVKEKKKKRKRDQGGEELPSDDKKKKQREREASGAIDDPTIDPPLEATGTTVGASEVKEKKKRNKNKSSAEASDPPPSSAIEFTPGAGAVDEPKKSRKLKSANDVVDADGDGETPPKSKSKSKKRKKEETIEDNEHPSTVLHTEGHSPQKRKKSKASVHPNPLDDSDLTEQSQKGSHSFPSPLQIPNTKRSFDCCSSYLHLLPIYLSRNLEIQQSPPKLDNPQHLDPQGRKWRRAPIHLLTRFFHPSGSGKVCPNGCRLLVQGPGAGERGM